MHMLVKNQNKTLQLTMIYTFVWLCVWRYAKYTSITKLWLCVLLIIVSFSMIENIHLLFIFPLICVTYIDNPLDGWNALVYISLFSWIESCYIWNKENFQTLEAILQLNLGQTTLSRVWLIWWTISLGHRIKQTTEHTMYLCCMYEVVLKV